MKKTLLTGAVLSLLSTSAMASQARLLALGMNETDNEGMYHIQDRRNIFLNPAWLNLYNNYVTAEFGDKGLPATVNAGTPGTYNTTFDKDARPKGQGGFFKKHGSMVYGLYLGAESNTSSLLRAAGSSAAAAVNKIGAGGDTTPVVSKMLYSADNQFDLFVAGEGSLKWGGNITFARGKDDARQASDLAMATRWGVMGDRWDAHLNLSLASKSKATDSVDLSLIGGGTVDVQQELKGKLGIQVGGSYLLSGNNRVFGYVKHYTWEQKDNYNYSVLAGPFQAALGGQQGTVKGDFTSLYLGWGTHMDTSDTGRVYLSLAGKKTDVNAKFNKKGEIRHLVVPFTIAYEQKAAEWLTLRGSVAQSIYSHKDNKNINSLNVVAQNVITDQFGANGKGTVANTTAVRAGATLTFGNLEFDGLLGATSTGELSFNDLLSRVALTYKF